MNLLDRYIARTLLSAVGLVVAVLVVLGLLFVFIGEQSDVGTGQYGMIDALFYSVMTLPDFVLESFPAGALIGALLGVGVLARSHEITIMRASGMSKVRLGGSMLVSALIMVAIALLIGELLAQPLGQVATQRKAVAKYSNVSFSASGSAWVRDGDRILNVQGSSQTAEFGGMLIFDLTPDGRVAAIGRAARATPDGKQAWRLRDYAESRFEGDTVSSTHLDERRLITAAGADFLRLTSADTDQLALHTLIRAIRYLRSNDLETRQYLFAFWARVARTVGILAAVLFALPFGFGSLRSASMSGRTTLGLALGVVYFFLQRLAESGTLVFNLNPLVFAWVPTALLAFAAVVLIWRLR